MATTELNQSQLLFKNSGTQGVLELSGGNMVLDATNQLSITAEISLSNDNDLVLENGRLVFRTNGDTYTPVVDTDTLFLDIVNNNTTSDGTKIYMYSGDTGENSISSYLGGTLTSELKMNQTTLTLTSTNTTTLSSSDLTLDATNINIVNSTGTTYTWPTTAPPTDNYFLQSTTTGTLSWGRTVKEYWWGALNADTGDTVFFSPSFQQSIAADYCQYDYVPTKRYYFGITFLMDQEYYDEWSSGSTTITFYKADTSSVTTLSTETFIKTDVTLINDGDDPSGTAIPSGSYPYTFTPQLVDVGEFISFRIQPANGIAGGEIGLGLFWY